MQPVTIRDARPEVDAAACAAIYAPCVEATPISFEERPPSAAEMAGRIERVNGTHPWLVAEDGGEVVGYAYGCPFRDRPAYRWTVEVTVYVAGDRHGAGIGRALYEALFARLQGQRFQVAFAGITLPNPASVALHERLGFARLGVSPRIGWKQGGWHDVGWWQLDLAPAGDERPPEPLPPG
ncbi:MAG TPA: arsinothricin resistance N-acetyltransferase ArsN1 family B [Solirubrobacterales bacterium]|nr:arsinothricin resistance N-acetyltransferase ArsN1 family B [Solirubrobacterales bacterium]